MPMPASPTWSHAVQAGTRSWWSSSRSRCARVMTLWTPRFRSRWKQWSRSERRRSRRRVGRCFTVAAVLGPRFRLDVLADAADVPLADVRDVLDGAERAGIVSFTEPGEGRFAHELVRDSIYRSLSAPERTRRHGEVASVLMRLGSTGRGVGAAEIASHLVLTGTGDAARATDFAWRAGDDARRIAAYADAARWYDQAIRCLDLAGGEDGQRCELLLASGEAHLGGGDRNGIFFSSHVSRRSRGKWPSRRSSPAPR